MHCHALLQNPVSGLPRRRSLAHERPQRRASKKSTGMRGHIGRSRSWSHEIISPGDAVDLEQDVFTKRTARQVALSLKRAADRSDRRRAGPYRSAMSMLSFHINRAGHSLSQERRHVLEEAKEELRSLYDKPARSLRPKAGRRRSPRGN